MEDVEKKKETKSEQEMDKTGHERTGKDRLEKGKTIKE